MKERKERLGKTRSISGKKYSICVGCATRNFGKEDTRHHITYYLNVCNLIRIVFVIGCDAWQIRRVLEF